MHPVTSQCTACAAEGYGGGGTYTVEVEVRTKARSLVCRAELEILPSHYRRDTLACLHGVDSHRGWQPIVERHVKMLR